MSLLRLDKAAADKALIFSFKSPEENPSAIRPLPPAGPDEK
jgi:hypothetical protein